MELGYKFIHITYFLGKEEEINFNPGLCFPLPPLNNKTYNIWQLKHIKLNKRGKLKEIKLTKTTENELSSCEIRGTGGNEKLKSPYPCPVILES